MALPKPNAKVCGVPVDIGKPIFRKPNGSPTTDESAAVPNFRYAGMSKPGAKRLVEALGLPLPKMGRAVQLCADQILANYSGSFVVERHAAGDFRGARRRRRRR